ncbi:putative transposase of insertion sequence ISRm10-1, orfA protein (plasmid) [Rhizobium grahamii CCGE 502]|uniref:Putative transposase of insertion sequence ISRm10-1, orfA protein n=1 Tax=Rhizobium grahamii CCGE 502 TaxID=990285 RepID=S3I1M3_9HYPH|nr:putative transposase of insertion sequence ISRm10-1, orfA protein [Rhizobium grahamii CCGE 502]
MSVRTAAARFGIVIFDGYCLDSQCMTPSIDRRQTRPAFWLQLDANEAFLIGLIDDITLKEMVLRLRTDKSVSIGRSALDVWLRKRGC